MISGISGGEFSKNIISKVFSDVDSNSDGQISKNEFQEAFSNILTQKMQGNKVSSSTISADDLFSKIDKDGDGNISKQELEQFIEKQKKIPPPPMPYGFNLLDLLMSADAEDIFSEIDANGDGVISQDEFVKYIEKQQAAMSAGLNTSMSGDNSLTAGLDSVTG